MPTVVVLGESMIELQHTGEKDLRFSFAGDAINCAAAVAAATRGARVQHITGVGDDERSLEFFEFCHSLGVDASASPVVPGATFGLYWITTVEGERRFQYWRSESATRQLLRSGDVLVSTPTPDLMILSGITLAVAGPSAGAVLGQIEAARRDGAMFAYDTNHRAALWPSSQDARHVSESAVALADTVHASTEDLDAIWGADDPLAFAVRLAAMGVREIVVTDGAESALAFVDGEEYWATPPDVAVVDTTGAGDAFFGTYLGQRLANATVEVALDAALDVSARVVASPGALSYLTNVS